MESPKILHPQTIVALSELIRANVDSGQSFEAAASAVVSAGMAALFRDIGRERGANAATLQSYAVAEGVAALTGEVVPSSKSASHRWWPKPRAPVPHGSAHAILCEAERGEDAIKDAYERMLLKVAGSPLSAVLRRQYRDVKQHHDQIRDLRERTAAAADL